jgi:hypothetical protein
MGTWKATAGVEFRARNRARQDPHAAMLMAGARRKKWRPSETVDEIIREGYRKFIEENNRHAIRRVTRVTGWPPEAVHRRAAELGLARVKERDWSLEEVAILTANSQYGMPVIQKRLAAAGFKRSRGGILLKRNRMGLIHAADGYSAMGLAKLMGIDAHVVMGWIGRGLAAEYRGTTRTAQQGGDSRFIKREDAREFLLDHPDCIDLRKVESRWFLNLITDGRIGQ